MRTAIAAFRGCVASLIRAKSLKSTSLLFALSPLLLEEVSQDGTAFSRHHARGDQQLVVHSRIVSERIERLDGPGFRVEGAIDQPFHAALQECAAAHGARLKSDVQRAFVEPPVSNGFCCLRDGDHFRVGRRVT